MKNAIKYGLMGIVLMTNLPVGGTAGAAPDDKNTDQKIEKIYKSEAEWKKQLTAEQFYVTRQKGTERAFSGEYYDTKTEGS